MIGHLSGQLAVVRDGEVVIDCHGVGYRVLVSAATLAQLPEVGARATLHTHLSVREDALTLYGFLTAEELELFEVLLGVSGVGPKVALSIVGALPPRQLAQAIAVGDEARLTSLPGVGKRLAQRLVVELGDRVAQRGWVVADDLVPTLSEVVDALTGLGFTMTEARRAARAAAQRLGEDAAIEALIREALRVSSQ